MPPHNQRLSEEHLHVVCVVPIKKSIVRVTPLWFLLVQICLSNNSHQFSIFGSRRHRCILPPCPSVSAFSTCQIDDNCLSRVAGSRTWMGAAARGDQDLATARCSERSWQAEQCHVHSMSHPTEFARYPAPAGWILQQDSDTWPIRPPSFLFSDCLTPLRLKWAWSAACEPSSGTRGGSSQSLFAPLVSGTNPHHPVSLYQACCSLALRFQNNSNDTFRARKGPMKYAVQNMYVSQ